ncbi:MAG: heparan-alpha-glucosaminide N-acetyltransferase domain-containing protein [Prevotellaceae bacterium]|jgi:predicted acyltransferase|nr:heparan-alpha-glucosaminide N-acetyltransferase domain-containing protein [Prevotellaceae bacterium]
MTSTVRTPKQRLVALDILRGITIAGMLLVNNPGSWSYVYAPLGHASWNGLTPTDLVFPFFMFIMGISTYISLRKYNFEFTRHTAWKVVRRAVLIYLIGLVLAWISLSFRTWFATANDGLSFGSHLWTALTNFENIRLLGVFPRLGISYGFAALIGLLMNHKHIPYLIAGTLIGYLVLLLVGRGFEYNETNILSVVDRAVLGVNHMYKDNGIDPEGLLSTIPAIAHVLIGFCFGRILLDKDKDITAKMMALFRIGAVIMFAGFLLSYGCPINKKVWSPSFVLVTCGMASLLLSLLIWVIDVKGYKKQFRFFEAYGVNPLFNYTLGTLLSILLSYIRVPIGDKIVSLHGVIYNYGLHSWLGDYPSSLAYALLFVVVVWLCGYGLYKRNIYIKI